MIVTVSVDPTGKHFFLRAGGKCFHGFKLVKLQVLIACLFVLFVCLFVWLVGWLVGWFVCLFVCLFVILLFCLFLPARCSGLQVILFMIPEERELASCDNGSILAPKNLYFSIPDCPTCFMGFPAW